MSRDEFQEPVVFRRSTAGALAGIALAMTYAYGAISRRVYADASLFFAMLTLLMGLQLLAALWELWLALHRPLAQVSYTGLFLGLDRYRAPTRIDFPLVTGWDYIAPYIVIGLADSQTVSFNLTQLSHEDRARLLGLLEERGMGPRGGGRYCELHVERRLARQAASILACIAIFILLLALVGVRSLQ